MSEISGTGKLDSRPFPLTLSFTAAPKNDGPSKARRVNGRTVQRSTVWSWKKMGGSENGKENEAKMRVMVLRYPKKQILHPWSLTWDLKIKALEKEMNRRNGWKLKITLPGPKKDIHLPKTIRSCRFHVFFFRANQLLSLSLEFQDEQTRDRTASPDLDQWKSPVMLLGCFFRPIVSGINYHPKK